MLDPAWLNAKLEATGGTQLLLADGHTRLHRLALDLETIDSMVETFQPMAKAGDVQAGALLAKFLESRRIKLGLELPRRADPLLVEAQAPVPRTSVTASPR